MSMMMRAHHKVDRITFHSFFVIELLDVIENYDGKENATITTLMQDGGSFEIESFILAH